MQPALQRYNPMERIDQRNQIPSNILTAMRSVVTAAKHAGADVIAVLLSAGWGDIAISSFAAFQMMGQPDRVSPMAIVYGLWVLETLQLHTPEATQVVAKLRSAGVDSMRYILDHPKVHYAEFGVVRPRGVRTLAISSVRLAQIPLVVAGICRARHKVGGAGLGQG